MTVPMVARNGRRLLEEMEHALHYWVAFLVIPIFGFANAGVTLIGLSPSDLLAPLPLGIALGLLLGKQIGIGYVRPDLAEVGTKLKVRMMTKLWDAEIVEDSPYDPTNATIRMNG